MKSLLTRAHDDFLALVAPNLQWKGERSPALPATRREADLVWEVAGGGGESGLLHIELQTAADAEMGERVAEYAIRLWRRYHLPVRSVVVYLRPSPSIVSPPFVIQFSGQESLRYSYDAVRLWEIPYERVVTSERYMLWPLAGLLRGMTAQSTLDIAERLAQAPIPEQDRRELIGILVTLAGAYLTQPELLQALRRNPMIRDLIHDSSISKALIEEGKAEGIAEGKAEATRDLARVALESRFAPLTDDVTAAVAGADVETLREIVGRITTITLEEVRARLGVH